MGEPKKNIKLKLKYTGNWVDIDKVACIPTGLWRFQRPVNNLSKCCTCGQCHLLCPTGSIREEEHEFHIDLSNCKGCGICASVCPNSAIVMLKEHANEP